jgi:hypothetical protein
MLVGKLRENLLRIVKSGSGTEAAHCTNIMIDSSFDAGIEWTKRSPLCVPSVRPFVNAKERRRFAIACIIRELA